MFSRSSKAFGLWTGLGLVLVLVCVTSPPADGIKVCGQKLSDALSLLCSNGFPAKVKKSMDPMDFGGDFDGAEDEASGLDSWPYLTGIESNSMAKTRRRRLGIVHECCLKSCSMSELMSYCRPIAH